MAIPSASSVVGNDGVTDGKVAARIETLGEELAAYAGVEGYPDTGCPESATAD